jgi:Divergent InlB B-repeat domain/IPT/TIG domain
LTRARFAPTLRRQMAIAAALMAMLTVALLISAGSAMAGVSGQIGDSWTAPAQFEGEELIDPSAVAFDSEDGSVFVASVNGEFTETVIRKFSATGVTEGSLTLPGRYVGMAVDPKLNRLYVLAGVRNGVVEATEILAFSTIPNSEGKLSPAQEEKLPVPTGSEALTNPQEIVVDPSTGNLIVVASAEADGKYLTTLQRIDVNPATGAGTVSARFVDEETVTNAGTGTAIAIDESGSIYVLGFHQVSPTMTADILPASFTTSSSLTPIPGFAAAIADGDLQGSGKISVPSTLANRGPQVAVSTSVDGEDTLYWKFETSGASADEFILEGWSVDGEARSAVFGGGTEEAECKISTVTTALAGLKGGNLAVFDQGTLVSEAGEKPEFFPAAYQFGPGGSKCPAPAPEFKLESEGQPVASVSAGSTVTFNGAGTELNAAPALEGGNWKVEGPCGSTEPIIGTALTLNHKFTVPGNYTVRMAIEADSPGDGLGRLFSATPRKLEVTPASGSTAPAVGCITPVEGPTAGGTEVTITGVNLTGATEVKFGDAAVSCTGVVSTCKVESDTEIKATTPVLAPGTTDVHVVTAAGESAADATADQFTAVGPPVPTFALTVSKAGSGAGSVISSPAGIKCGVTCSASFNEGSSVTLTATASSGSTFAGWGGACGGTASSCVVSIDAAKSVTATFNSVSTSEETQNPPNENKTSPPNETKPAPPVESKPAPAVETPKGHTPPPNKAKILAAQRKAALKKCQKLKGKAKGMCVKKANQIGKPKKKKKTTKGSAR